MSDLKLILNSVLEGSGRDPSNFPWASWGVSPARFSDKSKTEWVRQIAEEQGVKLNGVRHAHIPNNPANLEKIASIWAGRSHEKDISFYTHHRDEFYIKKICDTLPSTVNDREVRKLFSVLTCRVLIYWHHVLLFFRRNMMRPFFIVTRSLRSRLSHFTNFRKKRTTISFLLLTKKSCYPTDLHHLRRI